MCKFFSLFIYILTDVVLNIGVFKVPSPLSLPLPIKIVKIMCGVVNKDMELDQIRSSSV